jgi:ferredoxin
MDRDPRPAPRVTIDADLCIGSGECVRLAPQAFALDPRRGVSTPLPGGASVGTEVLEEAAFSCPTRAIALVADEA